MPWSQVFAYARRRVLIHRCKMQLVKFKPTIGIQELLCRFFWWLMAYTRSNCYLNKVCVCGWKYEWRILVFNFPYKWFSWSSEHNYSKHYTASTIGNYRDQRHLHSNTRKCLTSQWYIEFHEILLNHSLTFLVHI